MRWLAVLALATATAGCGSPEKRVLATTTARHVVVRCTHVNLGFRACTEFGGANERSAIHRRSAAGWKKVLGGVAGRRGWWRRVHVAPDPNLLLGEWSGECEIPTAYLVTVSAGAVRPLFGSTPSRPLGWVGRRARVRLLRPVYASRARTRLPSGVYLVDPQTLRPSLERRLPAARGC